MNFILTTEYTATQRQGETIFLNLDKVTHFKFCSDYVVASTVDGRNLWICETIETLNGKIQNAQSAQLEEDFPF